MVHPTSDIHLGGWSAVGMFVAALAGNILITQSSEYLEKDLGYRKPYFILYVAHSFLTAILPLHLFVVSRLQGRKPSAYIAGLRLALLKSLDITGQRLNGSSPFPTFKFVRMILLLTAGLTVPALLWYMSVSLTSISDATALANTNAIWAYGLSIWIADVRWETRRLVLVVSAIAGVMMIVYGGVKDTTPTLVERTTVLFSTSLIGDIFALFSSITAALYQVFYKKYASLPVGDKFDSHGYTYIPEEAAPDPVTPILPTALLNGPQFPISADDDDEPLYPTFGLYPNTLNSFIGISTFLLMWIPLPFLNWTGLEPFELPPTTAAWVCLFVLALSSVLYNVGFMIVVSLWGATLASVGHLLVIVIIRITDTLFGHGKDTWTIWSLLGSGFIVIAFSVLVAEEYKEERKRVSDDDRED